MATIQKTPFRRTNHLLVDATKTFAKPTTAGTAAIKHRARNNKENLSTPSNAGEKATARSRTVKRKLQHDEPSVTPVGALKRKLQDDDLDILSPDATKRKFKDDTNHILASLFSKPTSISTISKDMRVAVSIPRATKSGAIVSSHLSRAYKELLEQAGRSWNILENAAAAKNWHMVIKSGGSVFGMTGGGLVVGQKYKVPKPYAVLMRKIKETK
ncbi:hypothetical protein BZA77DRAFT_295186 [Pyronema omphalodes]|nr:hypothetical protein BZA77DRAFT_357637 [Pyronema omphalodes]KAI5814323.1 hypothetical protein BZA77DRAFT_295186 [Pyronema omphalodes]